MYSEKYELVVPEYRKSVDLRQFREVIELSVHKSIPGSKTFVYEQYFEIHNAITPSRGQLSLMGKQLTINSEELNRLKRKHISGYHLFRKVRSRE